MRSFLRTSTAGWPKTNRLARGGEEQPEQQLDGRRLAGTVRPEQAEDFAFADLQVERVEGDFLAPAPEIAVNFGQAPRFDNEILSHSRPLNPRVNGATTPKIAFGAPSPGVLQFIRFDRPNRSAGHSFLIEWELC